MVFDHILKFFLQRAEDLRIGSDDGALMSIASRQVLTGDDGDLCHLSGGTTLQQDQLGVIIGEETAVDGLNNEGPQTERLVRGFVIKEQLNTLDLPGTAHVVESPDEFLRDGERGLTDGCLSGHLGETPLHHIRHLQLITQVGLYRTFLQRAQNPINRLTEHLEYIRRTPSSWHGSDHRAKSTPSGTDTRRHPDRRTWDH